MSEARIRFSQQYIIKKKIKVSHSQYHVHDEIQEVTEALADFSRNV